MKKQKLRLAYLTSCRELGTKGHENVGRAVTDQVSGQNYGYRKSCLETLAKLLTSNTELAEHYTLKLVMFDDTPQELQQEWSEAELWPRDDLIADGIAHVNVPSLWRKMHGAKKKEHKETYEKFMVEILHRFDIDLIIVDSYRCILEHTFLNAFRGKVINVHPGLIDPDPAKTPGATPTRDALTRAKYGYIIVDDKKEVFNDTFRVVYQRKARQAVKVPQIAKTGVTIHRVTKEVDDGRVILSKSYDFDPETATEEFIRNTNYKLKNRLLPEALLTLATEQPA